jgi:hypothetical protein
MLDVGCWMFSSFGSGVQSTATYVRAILSPLGTSGENVLVAAVAAPARRAPSVLHLCPSSSSTRTNW